MAGRCSWLPGSGGRLAFFVVCLAVGVAAVVAVAGLSAGVDDGLRSKARELLAADLVFFAAAFGPLGYFYAETLRAAGHRAWPAVLVRVPLILALGIGLSINNSRALIVGLFGRAPAEFVRTPKRGGSKRGYRARTCGWGTAAEAALAAYVTVAVGFAVVRGLYFSIPFLLLFLYGFAIIAAGSVEATVRRREMPVRS